MSHSCDKKYVLSLNCIFLKFLIRIVSTIAWQSHFLSESFNVLKSHFFFVYVKAIWELGQRIWHPKWHQRQEFENKKFPMAIIVYALTVIQCLAKLIYPNHLRILCSGKIFSFKFLSLMCFVSIFSSLVCGVWWK